MGICYVIQGAQPSAPWQLRGLGWSGRWEGMQERGDTHTYIYLWLIHADVQQRPTQHCRATVLWLKKEKNDSPKEVRAWRPRPNVANRAWPGASHREYPKPCVKGDPAGEARCQPFSQLFTVGKLSLQLGSPLSICIQRSTLTLPWRGCFRGSLRGHWYSCHSTWVFLPEDPSPQVVRSLHFSSTTCFTLRLMALGEKKPGLQNNLTDIQGPRGHYAKGSKSNREGQTLHVLTYRRNLFFLPHCLASGILFSQPMWNLKKPNS